MQFTPLRKGFVTRRTEAAGHGALAVGSRAVALPGGDLLCSCALTSALTVNDFVPVLYRSADRGATWQEQGPVWPHLRDRWSIFVSVSRDADGGLYLYGTRTPIDRPGETFWSDATQGLKA